MIKTARQISNYLNPIFACALIKINNNFAFLIPVVLVLIIPANIDCVLSLLIT